MGVSPTKTCCEGVPRDEEDDEVVDGEDGAAGIETEEDEDSE